MSELFTGDKQKFNNETLLLVSTTHSGDIYSLQKNKIQHLETVDIDLRPYPEKHGQMTSSSSSGNLQSAGMVYERDHEEEIKEYLEKIGSELQGYIKKHDDEILRILVTVPAKIKGNLHDAIKDHLHNVHINDMYIIEGNYGNMPTPELISILNTKDIAE